MTTFNNKTQAQKVITALKATDKGLTEAQMSARFNIASPRAVVNNLRSQGYAIYTNRKTDTVGRTKTFYRLGTPKRSVVAAGFAALGV